MSFIEVLSNLLKSIALFQTKYMNMYHEKRWGKTHVRKAKIIKRSTSLKKTPPRISQRISKAFGMKYINIHWLSDIQECDICENEYLCIRLACSETSCLESWKWDWLLESGKFLGFAWDEEGYFRFLRQSSVKFSIKVVSDGK